MSNKEKLNGGAPAPYYDKEQRAMIQEDVHLMPENQEAALRKEYHVYNVDDLKKNVASVDQNIEVFNGHIEKEKERKKELLSLIKEGEERDRKLAELGF